MNSATARRWVVGTVAALAPIWAVSLLLSNSVEPVAWDDRIDATVPPAGIEHQHRTEGWARSRMGRHGIWGIDDVTAVNGPKVAIWGNSQVEGLMLDDGDKIAQQITRRWRERFDPPLTAYAVAVGGTDVRFVWQRLPDYQRVVTPTVHHIVVVPDIAYLAPFSDTEPTPPGRPSTRLQTALGTLRSFRLGFLYHLADQARRTSLRFAPGTAATTRAAPRRKPSGAAWERTVEMARATSPVPVSFLYAPTVPVLLDGRAVDDDPGRADFEAFRLVCTARGLTCRSLARDFTDFHQATGAFPRGFANHHPYRGHLNRDGAGLVAEAAVALLADALHPG